VGSYRCVQRDIRVAGPVLTVTGVVNNGGGNVRLTIGGAGVPSWLATGAPVSVQGVGGTTEANGTWTVTVVDSAHLDLGAVAYANAYTSGGRITVTGVGAAFESCESCRAERLDVSGIGATTGAQAGLYVYGSRASTFEHVTVGGCWGVAGVVVDSGTGPYGSVGASFSGVTTTGCGNGLVVYDGAARVRVSRSRFDGSTYDGVLVTTDGSTFPSGLTLDDLEVTSGGADGIHLAGGDDTTMRNVRVLGNATNALEIAAAAVRTRVDGGRFDSNGGDLALISSDLWLANLVAVNNGSGVETTGVSTNVTATNVAQFWTTGGGTARGWYANGGGYWNLVNCLTNFTGSTGVKIGVVAQASSIVRVTNFTALAGGTSYSLYINGGGAAVYYGANDLVDTTVYGVQGTVQANGAMVVLR
jgi:hypothetical protein